MLDKQKICFLSREIASKKFLKINRYLSFTTNKSRLWICFEFYATNPKPVVVEEFLKTSFRGEGGGGVVWRGEEFDGATLGGVCCALGGIARTQVFVNLKFMAL